MINLEARDVLKITQYTVENFEKWIFNGIEIELNSKDYPNKESFAPLNMFIGLHDDIVEDIQAIYYALPKAEAQPCFRLGLRDVLKHLRADPFFFPHFKVLLSIACAIEAYEVIIVLPDKVGKGFFGMDSYPMSQGVFINALETYAIFAGSKDNNVQNGLVSLINSLYFRPEYSDVAFIALCRNDPDNFIEHFRLLRTSFQTLFNENEINFAQMRRLAERFSLSVTPNIIAENLYKLSMGSYDSEEPNDSWFIQALFDNDIVSEPPPPLSVCYDRCDISNSYHPKIIIKRTIAPIDVFSTVKFNFQNNREESSKLYTYLCKQTKETINHWLTINIWSKSSQDDDEKMEFVSHQREISKSLAEGILCLAV